MLEGLSDRVSAFGEHVKGPFRVVSFAGQAGEVAVLSSTGETSSKAAQLFKRHVSTFFFVPRTFTHCRHIG